MDFILVLELIGRYLEKKNYLYAVIGGLGLAAYGRLRTTFDLDFVAESRAQEDIIRFLESKGYETLHRSSGYSNHIHPDANFGGLDFVYINLMDLDDVDPNRVRQYFEKHGLTDRFHELEETS